MEELINRISKVPVPQRIAAVAGVLVLLVLVGYYFFISPVKSDIVAKERRLSSLEDELAKNKVIADYLPRYRVEVERLKQRLNEALTELPNEAEIPELLQKLAILVEQSDCAMATFEPQNEVMQAFYASIPVAMQITGNYHSIAVFFDKVSKLPRIVNVTEIKLSSPTVENQKVVLTANFTATTFKFVETKGQGGGSKSGFRR